MRNEPVQARSAARLAALLDATAGVLDEVDRALVAVVSGPDGLPELRRAVDLLSDTMTSHLSYEERELVDLLSMEDVRTADGSVEVSLEGYGFRWYRLRPQGGLHLP